MLQTRSDNEQFTSLPDIFTNNRSRNGFISTDRPDSSHRVDLHVYVIPKTVWRNVQHLAQNEAMNDAISAGFVRVSPEMNLHDLRDIIEQLCRNETYFPRDFIFLRSVGRCLTRVKSKQEIELKVKNYRPPQTFAPEIYLLEGRHEDYTSTPSASPALSTASYLFGSRFQHPIHNNNDQGRTPIQISPSHPSKTIRTEKRRLPALKTKSFSNGPTPIERKSAANLTSSGSTLDIDEPPLKELYRVKEEQERLRHRQIELERMRRFVEAKKPRREHSETERRRARRDPPVPTERRVEIDRSPVEIRRVIKPDTGRHRKEVENRAATKIQATFRGFKSRQQMRERHRKLLIQRREAETKRVRQIEEDAKQKAKELEEKRRRNLIKRQKRNDVESLRIRLKDVQTRRLELEQLRAQLVKALPLIHHQITIQRKEARDMWKKKYYVEKKKTPALEDQQKQLKLDLEQIQQKILQTIENESKHLSHMGHLKGSQIDDFILQITRIQHQVQDLNYQIDHAKLRLTTDIKLRSQAEHECATLRHELNQAKMNLNHIKNRVEI